jgi:hypothetical protein
MQLNRRVVASFAIAALLGVVVGIGAGMMAPGASLAASCSTGGTRYNSEAKNNDGSGNHYGVGDLQDGPDGMWIGTDAAGCARVSSLIMIFGPNDYAEAGWYRTASDYPIKDSCAPHTDAPHLIAATLVSGSFHCQDGAALSTGQRDGWKLVNADGNTGDTHWDYVHNGTSYDSKNTCCMLGFPITNGERHNSSEDAYADMPRMDYYSISGGGWFEWGSSAKYADSDPSYLPQCYSAVHVGSATTTANAC